LYPSQNDVTFKIALDQNLIVINHKRNDDFKNHIIILKEYKNDKIVTSNITSI